MMIESDTGVTGDVAGVAGRPARHYAVLAVIAAILTIGLKLTAYVVTGSIGLLSDAAESLVNLAAAVFAFWALSVAARPPDEEHAYGHSKAEYFASALEGSLILLAALGIAGAAWLRLWEPQPLENVGLGLAVSLVASAVNGGTALVLMRAGRRLRSITLLADARHLLTDVWTSVGVVVGIILVALTGWLVLDPVIALLVALNIIWTGVRLMHETAHGLLDTTLPPDDRKLIAAVLAAYTARGIDFHALRTRVAGQRRFISLHVLVPGHWSVHRGHGLCEELERDLIRALPGSTIFTHLESLEDPASWEDQELDRASSPREQGRV